VGSGYFCPLVNGPAFLSASLLAAKTGGLSLVFGMTAVGGVFEAVFSRVAARMRAFFPAEVTGTVVTMVGIEVIGLSVPKFLGVDKTHPDPELKSILVAGFTFLAMAGFTVWGRGKLRLFAVLWGMLLGYLAAALAGLLSLEHARQIGQAPLFTFPHFCQAGLSFKLVLLVPFLAAALSSALKTMGDLTTCQKINDADWKRPDMKSIGRGIAACAAGNLLSGCIGALGQSVSSSNIGLSIASGATARRIALANGGILIVLAFVPRLAEVFVVMPTPVMGASLIFAIGFMLVAGIQIIASRMLDARKTFVIGISLILGLSVEICPGLYAKTPAGLAPIFHSSLALCALSAILLNLLFRIGVARHKTIELQPGAADVSDKIFEFMERQGGLWGARKEVVYDAMAAMNEFMEAAAAQELTAGPVALTVAFDEFNLDVAARYQGVPIEFPDRKPTREEMRADPAATGRLAGYLIKRYADRVSARSANGVCTVNLHFVH
jgi:NCS2 family nucleobase:cation symporter-2